jgi:hypothetical protein
LKEARDGGRISRSTHGRSDQDVLWHQNAAARENVQQSNFSTSKIVYKSANISAWKITIISSLASVAAAAKHPPAPFP